METFVPVLGAASCVLLLTQQQPVVWLGGAIALAVGIALYFGVKALRARSSE